MAEQDRENLETEKDAEERSASMENSAGQDDTRQDRQEQDASIRDDQQTREESQEDSGEAPVPETEGNDAEEGEEAPETQGGMTWAERKAAKKQAKQDKKEDACKEKIDQLEDRVKRQMAEFENFRKRSDREKQAMFETGAKSVLEKILPVIDNFERGLQTVPPENRADPFVDGMNRIYKQLLTELENMGVVPIEAVGKEFDPNFHNAVMQVESDEYESGIVAQELLRGYLYRDTVVRHSMVAVVV